MPHRKLHRLRRARRRALRFEPLEDRRLLAVDWRNPVNSLDVSGDGFISPLDALQPINELNDNGPHALADQRPGDKPYWDASGDQFISPLDALQVINALNDNRIVPYVLGEGQQIAAEQSVTITVGQAAGTRTYRLQVDATFDSTDTVASSDDLLAIYLVDPQQPATTLLDRGTPGTTLFTLSESGAEFVPGRVRWDGQVVEIDLSELTDRDTAELRLQLLNTDGDRGSRVAVRPLTNEVDPSGEIGPRLLDTDTPFAAGAAVNLTSLTAASDVNVLVENVRFSSATQRYTAELRLQNTGDSLGRSIAMAFPDLPSGVTLRNPSGTTADGDPYINFAPAISRGGLSQHGRSELLLVEFDDPTRVPFALTPQILAGTNQPPTLAAISPLTVMPGGKLATQLTATDPDGDVITFALGATGSASASALDLPTGILRGNGQLEFTPAPNELGTYTFDVIASDGALDARQSVTLDVVADPSTTTRVSGFILDVDQSPLAGMQVEIGAVQGLTLADGSFTLDLGSGPIVGDTLKVRGELFAGSLAYPFIAEKLALMLEHDIYPGVNNVIDRDIYLPILDLANGHMIDPLLDTLVTTNAIPGMSVFIAAGTLMNQQGTPFNGLLSITEVPADRTPISLPDTLLPDFLVTIQPGEMVFATPAPVTFPNRVGWEPGALMDLWSINPVTGQFEDVGDMRVSANGARIETISGGVRTSSWHGVRPALSCSIGTKDDTCKECEDKANKPSPVPTHTGSLMKGVGLPSYQSQGQSHELPLIYDSLRADPRPIVQFEVTSSGFGAPSLGASLTFQRGSFSFQVPGLPSSETGGPDGQHFWSAAPGGNLSRAALQADLSGQPSGLYSFEIVAGRFVTVDGQTIGGSEEVSGEILHVNTIDSPFGSGWGLAGLQEIVENPDGSLLLIDGDGSESLFRPPAAPGESYVSPPGDFTVVERLIDGTIRRTWTDQTVDQFDGRNKLASTTDRNGNRTEYLYDALGNLQQTRDPVGLLTTFEYAGSRVTSITEPAGRVTRLEYDSAGNLTRILGTDGSQRNFGYDSLHHLTSEVDPLGRHVETLYDFAGRVTRVVMPDGSVRDYQPLQTAELYPPERTMTMSSPPPAFPEGAAIARYTDGNGNVTTVQLDAAGQRVRATDGVGSMSSYERNGQDLVTRVTNARGQTTDLTYDDRGNLVRVADAIALGGRGGSGLFLGELFPAANVPFAVATGDLNNDSYPDVVTVSNASTFDGGVTVLFNDGNDGLYDRLDFPLELTEESSVDLGDLNQDGNLDFVIAAGALTLFLGDGAGGFAQQTLGQFGAARLVNLKDMNGDGNLDWVFADYENSDPVVRVLLGDGQGGIGGSLFQTLDFYPFALEVGDLDGDGDLDAVATTGERVPSNPDTVLTFLNDGGGDLGPPTAVLNSSPTASRLVLGDFNGDQFLDLVTANAEQFDPPVPPSLSVFSGDGQGGFGMQVSLSASFVLDMRLEDVNHDGAQDIVTIEGNANEGNDRVVVIRQGNGLGGFSPAVDAPPGVRASGLDLADTGGDGLLDLVLIDDNTSTASIYSGRGDGLFLVNRRFVSNGSPNSVSLGDMNNDGAIDAINTNAGCCNVGIQLGDPSGAFALPTNIGIPNGLSRPIATVLGDLNNDGNLDIAVADRNAGAVQILLGDGLGGFDYNGGVTVSGFGSTHAVDLVDLNGDGNLDVVAGTSDGVKVALGNGAGGFGSPSNPGTGIVRSVAVGDVNGDGNPDIVAANQTLAGSWLTVLLGDGLGGFAPQIDIPTTPVPMSVSLADFNRDGNLDAVLARFSSGAVVVHPGDGLGGFGASTELATGTDTTAVTTVDLDDDGNFDIIAMFTGGFSYLRGDGEGAFATPRQFAAHGPGLAVADLNGDDRPDVVTTGQDNTLVVHLALPPTAGAGIPRGTGAVVYTYDGVFNQMTSMTDELGHVTLYEIDPANGNMLSTTQVVGSMGGADDLVTTFTYTTHGLVNTVTDPLGRVTDYDYDSLDRLIQVTSALGTPDQGITLHEYDVAGNLTAMTDENGHRKVYEYDALNRPTKITSPDPDGAGALTSPVTQFAYDANGNQTQVTDPRNNLWLNQYDTLDRLVKTIDPNNAETRTTFDAAGNRASVTDSLNQTTRYDYDSRNRVIRSIDPAGGVTQFTYDADDQLTSLTDSVGNTTRYQYDARGRVVRRIDPLGLTTEYKWDPVNNLIATVDRNGRRTEYAYDDVDRLTSEHWVGGGNTITYAYDKASNLLSSTDTFSGLAMAYDSRNRVRTMNNAGTLGVPNVVLTYAYDAASNLLSTTDTIGGTPSGLNSYSYDALDRVTRIVQSGANVSDKRVDLAYNSLGQFSSTERFKDLGGTQLVVGTSYTYDSLNRLTGLHHRNAASNDLSFFDFVYDTHSRIMRITDIDGATDYNYNTRDELTGANHADVNNPDETYSYDANGNRITSSRHGSGYVTGANNRLLSDGTFNYSYDSEGNLSRRTEIATGKVRDFSWDYRNRLTAVIDKTAANVETQKVALTYDTYGRRISKAVDTTPLDTVDAAITHFVYDGQDVLLDFIDNDGSGPAAPTLAQRYLHGAAVDQVLAQDDGVGNTLWHLSDHLGTVRDLVDSTGVVRNHLIYDSYGWLISQSNAAANSRYGFTGREHDNELAQIYYRARHYDAAVGLFISEDPIDFGGGDANLASYVGNSPVLARDPSGMVWWDMSSYNCGGLALGTYEPIPTAAAVRQEITKQHGEPLKDCKDKCKPCETKVWLYVRHDVGKDEKGKLKDGDFHVFSGQSDCKTGADPGLVVSKNGKEQIIVGPPEFFKMQEHQGANFGDVYRANIPADLPLPIGLIPFFGAERPGQVGRTEECYCIPNKSK